jgi:hypothetical protein
VLVSADDTTTLRALGYMYYSGPERRRIASGVAISGNTQLDLAATGVAVSGTTRVNGQLVEAGVVNLAFVDRASGHVSNRAVGSNTTYSVELFPGEYEVFASLSSYGITADGATHSHSHLAGAPLGFTRIASCVSIH